MPVRSSEAAEKAMQDGDLAETSHRSLAGDTITHCPSTRANLGDASMVGNHNHVSRTLPPKTATDEVDTTAAKSTRTCRHHVVDGKPLLKRQRAAVWNRPSIARPPMLALHNIAEDSTSTLSSLSLHSLESFTSYTDMGGEMACLEEECEDFEDAEFLLVGSSSQEEEKSQESDMHVVSKKTMSRIGLNKGRRWTA